MLVRSKASDGGGGRNGKGEAGCTARENSPAEVLKSMCSRLSRTPRPKWNQPTSGQKSLCPALSSVPTFTRPSPGFPGPLALIHVKGQQALFLFQLR